MGSVLEAANTPAVELENVSVNYKSKSGMVPALDRVSMALENKGFVAVVGPSGCGKSTLLKIISRVLPVSSGTVRLYGRPIDEADLTGKLSYVFQRPLLLPWRTALQNVLLPFEVIHKRVGPEHVERARQMLALTGLEQFADKAPHELSGGMQQRVSLARALSIEPQFLLMDEPFSALDEITRETMQEELLRIWQHTRNTILFITHSISEAVLLADKVVLLSRRPGTVVRIFDVKLPRPREDAIRRDPDFLRTVHEIREILRGTEGVRV